VARRLASSGCAARRPTNRTCTHSLAWCAPLPSQSVPGLFCSRLQCEVVCDDTGQHYRLRMAGQVHNNVTFCEHASSCLPVLHIAACRQRASAVAQSPMRLPDPFLNLVPCPHLPLADKLDRLGSLLRGRRMMRDRSAQEGACLLLFRGGDHRLRVGFHPAGSEAAAALAGQAGYMLRRHQVRRQRVECHRVGGLAL
jgi:hypothetical protein